MELNKELTSSAAELYHGQVSVLRTVLSEAEKRADDTEAKLTQAKNDYQVVQQSF
jgi:hypothetical protein